MILTADQTALRAAIIEHPDEDTPRLEYADLLDEVAGYHTERAHHIRWAVRHPQNSAVCLCSTDSTGSYYHRCWVCLMLGDEISDIPCYLLSNRSHYVLNRGFVCEVRTDWLSDFMVERDVPCPACEEGGIVDYETNVIECRRCDSTGVIDTEFVLTKLKGVCHRHPIKSVWPMEMTPVEIGGTWNWMKGSPERESPWFLPEPVWDLLGLDRVSDVGDRAKTAKTRRLADDAMTKAFADYIRSEGPTC